MNNRQKEIKKNAKKAIESIKDYRKKKESNPFPVSYDVEKRTSNGKPTFLNEYTYKSEKNSNIFTRYSVMWNAYTKKIDKIYNNWEKKKQKKSSKN